MELRLHKYAGFCKHFQGLGFMVITDEPCAMYETVITAEIRLLWFKAWVQLSKPVR